MTAMRHLPVIAGLAAACMAHVAQAQMLPPPAGADGLRNVMIQRMMTMPTLLNLSADAEVTRPPDTLRLSAGVVTNAVTAAEATAANAARMNAVIAALKAAGATPVDLQTSNLSVSPQYRYNQGQSPVVTGYQARNSVTVRTRKLADAGKLVDALVKAGANEVNGPMFSLADPEAALNEARAAAIGKARARAEVYAAAAGLTVKRIASISEPGSEPPMPVNRPMMRAEAMAIEGTPVEPGELNLSVQVKVSFELDERKP
jgi:uncharacterized protein YggE